MTMDRGRPCPAHKERGEARGRGGGRGCLRPAGSGCSSPPRCRSCRCQAPLQTSSAARRPPSSSSSPSPRRSGGRSSPPRRGQWGRLRRQPWRGGERGAPPAPRRLPGGSRPRPRPGAPSGRLLPSPQRRGRCPPHRDPATRGGLLSAGGGGWPLPFPSLPPQRARRLPVPGGAGLRVAAAPPGPAAGGSPRGESAAVRPRPAHGAGAGSGGAAGTGSSRYRWQSAGDGVA